MVDATVGIITVKSVAGMAGTVQISIKSIMAHAPLITLRGSEILCVTIQSIMTPAPKIILPVFVALLAVMMVAIALQSAVTNLGCVGGHLESRERKRERKVLAAKGYFLPMQNHHAYLQRSSRSISYKLFCRIKPF